MEPLWLIIAFLFGFIFKQLHLPPLVGFLVAGFVLNFLGVKDSLILEEISNIGILLLLFTIGLKLKIKKLLSPEILATASLNMLLVVSIFGTVIWLLCFFALPLFTNLTFQTSLLIAFALSFSSTVFAVKVLEEKSETSSPIGRISIGILIVQDIIAILFISFSSSKLPSVWAFALLLLLLIPWLIKLKIISELINKIGHGELLILFGILLPISFAFLFEGVGLKADFGALVAGVLISNHPKAEEMSKALLNFKDLFLVGFFLTIGLFGIPTFTTVAIAIFFVLLLPLKSYFFFYMLTKLKLRARTSSIISFSLTNYSEFGLIIGIVGYKAGWISEQWLVVFALALAISFIISAPLNSFSHSIYSKFHNWFQRFESSERLSFEQPIRYGDAKIVILGMGRMGVSVYDELEQKLKGGVVGVEYNEDAIKKHKLFNRNILIGDATDTDFWERACPVNDIETIVLTLPKHSVNVEVLTLLRENNFAGKIIAVGSFDDEIEELKELGANRVFNYFAEAGVGFADHIYEAYDDKIESIK